MQIYKRQFVIYKETNYRKANIMQHARLDCVDFKLLRITILICCNSHGLHFIGYIRSRRSPFGEGGAHETKESKGQESRHSMYDMRDIWLPDFWKH